MASGSGGRAGGRAPWPVVGLFALLGVALAGIGALSDRHHAARHAGETSRALEAIAEIKAAQIAAWLEEQREEAEFLHGNRTFADTFSRLLAGDPDAPREIADWVAPTRAKNPGWTFVTLLDSDLRQRAHFGESGEPELGAPERELVAAAAAQRRVLLSELLGPAPDNPLHLHLAAPIADARGAVLGSVFVRIDPAVDLLPLLEGGPAPSPTTETLLVRREGDSVRYLGGLRLRPEKSGELRLPLSPALPEAAAVLGATGAFAGRDYRGVPVLATLKPVPRSAWRLVAKIDTEEIEAPQRRQMLTTGATAVLLLLAAASLFGAYWERRRRLEASLLLEAERAALAAASRYAAVMRNANDGILLADEELRLIDVNPRFEQLTGFTRAELLAMRVSDLRAPEARFDLESRLEEVRRNDGGIYETVHRRKDGNAYPVEVSVRIVEVGGQRLLLAHVRDISERRSAERRIRRLNAELEERVAARTAQLEESVRELESFGYSVSHDLRAPLRAIEGFSKILVDLHAPAFDPEARRMLGVVSANARRMARLIDDLLAFSRLGRTSLRADRVDTERLVREVIDELCPPEARARVRFQIGALPPCRGDGALLRQVWTNLVDNALKFSSRRGQALVEIGGERRGDEIVYHVRDNGVGFDMQYADKLFGVFQRLHGPEQFEGTGVGLAIVQRIVRRHGGRVWAESRPEEGALFGFALPAEGVDG